MNAFLYLMTVCIWGSTWLAIKCQLGIVPIDVSIFYRFGLASLLIFLWCLWRKLNLKFSGKTHLFLAGQGFFLFSINYVAMYMASGYIAGGLNAIGFSMVLVFNMMNAFLLYKTPLTRPIICGAICGMVGMIIVFWPAVRSLDFSNGSLIGIFLSLLGAFLSSIGNMISARNQKEKVPVLESNAYAMGYGALWMLSVVLIKGEPFQFDTSLVYVLSLLHLTVFGSIVAFGCYLTLLGRMGASKAAYALVMVPIVALGVSSLFEDLVWEPHIFMGVALILLGNIIILGRKRPPSSSTGTIALAKA